MGWLAQIMELLCCASARRWWRAALVAMPLSWLSLLVLLAGRFSHDERWLRLLDEHAGLGWLVFLLWLTLLEARRRLDPVGTEVLTDHGVHTPGLALALLVVVASPFANAYFTHVTHPVLAACIAWTLHPFVARIRLPRVSAAQALPTVLFVGGATLYFLQSYRRHIWFGSGGKDLGLFHQSVWLLSRFESPDNTVMGMHAFADHMEGIDLAAVPLQWLWPSAGALLLFQALIVAAGVIAVVGIARRTLGSDLAAAAVGVVYLLAFDLQQAVMFDWNPTTCGAALLPWVVWAFQRRRVLAFGLALAAVAVAKENLVLYGIGLCLSLSVGARRDERRAPLLGAAALLVLFVLEMKVLFPIFRPEGFRHLRFEAMGQSPLEMLAALAESPMRAFSVLFVPGRKINGLLVPFSTVAFTCWLAPRWALALLPPLLERFWSSHSNRWWGHHYGAGIAVIAVLASIDGLATIRRWALNRDRRSWFTMAVSTVFLSGLLIAGAGRYGPGPLLVWRHDYYTTPADRLDARAILAVVPDDASVAAQNHLIPHLSGRRQIYEISRPIEAEYVVLDLVQSAWPYEAHYPLQLARELIADGYGTVACEGAAVLLRRGADSVPCAAVD